jgi:tungstate transport system ATP-binding protein
MPDEAAKDGVMRDRPTDLPICFEAVDYRVGALAILSGITLDVGPGAPTLLLGPNGSGKTTLLKLGMELLTPSAGRLTFAGRSRGVGSRRALLFQKPVMLRRTAAANVSFALTAAGRAADRAAVTHLLHQVGLAGFEHRPARRLSWGEQQRLALARALARDPEVLFLDEPTASLDPAATKAVEEIIVRIAGAGVKIVMATHDLGQARRLASDVVFLVAGRVIEHGPAPDFFVSPSTDKARRFLAGDLVI